MENINLSRVLIDNDNPSICCNDDLCKNANYVKRLVIMTWVFLDFTILKNRWSCCLY